MNPHNAFEDNKRSSFQVSPPPKRRKLRNRKCSGVFEITAPLKRFNQPAPAEKGKKIYGDDDDGHLMFEYGDILHNYELLSFLGKGTFGRVVRARHIKTTKTVAVKITKNSTSGRANGSCEISVLQSLKQIDPDGKKLWVDMTEWFEFQGHMCLVFELLGDSLYSFLRDNKFQPYTVTHIRHIAYQMIFSVQALHANSIVHTDLKPENFCFVSSKYNFGLNAVNHQTFKKVIDTDIKLIDFGSAAYVYDEQDTCIQTRNYRAPEVMFNFNWTEKCDIWSIGCILFELYTGSCLFPVRNDAEHIFAMKIILGPLPDEYRETSVAKKNARIRCSQKMKLLPLKEYMKMSSKVHQDLFDLIENFVEYMPDDRMSLSEALQHPFFHLLPDDNKIDPSS